MSKHKHADLMLAYAQDAQESDTPWLLWEYRDNFALECSSGWKSLKSDPSWHGGIEYRRKSKTIRIGEYDVPEPLQIKPDMREKYYFVTFKGDDNVHSYFWSDDNVDNQLLSNRVVHLNREAAELHAIALISLTKL